MKIYVISKVSMFWVYPRSSIDLHEGLRCFADAFRIQHSTRNRTHRHPVDIEDNVLSFNYQQFFQVNFSIVLHDTCKLFSIIKIPQCRRLVQFFLFSPNIFFMSLLYFFLFCFVFLSPYYSYYYYQFSLSTYVSLCHLYFIFVNQTCTVVFPL